MTEARSGERHERFTLEGEAEVEVAFPSGSLRVVAAEAGRVDVLVRGPQAGDFEVRHRGRSVSVRLEGGFSRRWADHDVVVAVPAGTAVRTRVASAGVTVETPLRSLDVHSAAGDVVAGEVTGSVTAKAATGGVRLGRTAGHVRVSSASGDVEVEVAEGSVAVNTAGGDVRLGRVAGPLSVRSASGDVVVRRYGGTDLSCATVSGDVSIGLEPGLLVDLDVSSLAGGIRNAFAVDDGGEVGGGDGGEEGPGTPGRVKVRSTAGDIELLRAAPRPARSG